MLDSRLPEEDVARACVESGSAADWEEFVRLTHGLIARVAYRLARQWGETSPQVVDDLVQEAYLKLCGEGRQILRGVGTPHPGSLFGFLKVMTANLVHDHFKALHAQRRGGGRHAGEIEAADIAAGSQWEGSAASIERAILLKEIEGLLCRSTAGPDQKRNQQIFWLHYRQGLSARAIASLPYISLTAKGVESILLRMMRLIRAEMSAGGQTAQGRT